MSPVIKKTILCLIGVFILLIFFSVYLASLNGRGGHMGRDAAIKAYMFSIRAEAENYLNKYGNYGPNTSVCSQGLFAFASTSIVSIGIINDKHLVCGAKDEAWALSARLFSDRDEWWCIDSVGTMAPTTHLYSPGFTSCNEGSPDDGAIGEFWGSIQGTVLLGPTCPVVRNPPDPSCDDRPYATQLEVVTADTSRVIKKISSSEDGKFNVEVPPGSYVIRGAGTQNTLPYCGASDVVRVEANGYAQVIVSCDTGIR